MNIFFDVDYTLICMDGSLRPRAHEVFQSIKNDGHDIYIWSGVGLRHSEVRQHGLEPYVSGVFEKPLGHFETSLARLHIPVEPEFVVDDYPEIVEVFGGFVIKPYVFRNPSDRELERVYSAIQAFADGGNPDEPGFRRKGQFRRPPARYS